MLKFPWRVEKGHGRISSSANVVIKWLFLHNQMPSGHCYNAKQFNPTMKKCWPKLIIKAGHIFQPKNVKISGNNHKIKEQNNFNENGTPEYSCGPKRKEEISRIWGQRRYSIPPLQASDANLLTSVLLLSLPYCSYQMMLYMKRGTVADAMMAKVIEAVSENCLSNSCEKKLSVEVVLAITKIQSCDL